MKRFSTAIACLCMVVLGLGSALAGTVQKTGYLQSYKRLYHIGGVPVEQVWINPEFDIRNYKRIYIAPMQIDPCAYVRGGNCDHQTAERLSYAFHAELTAQLSASGIFEFASNDPFFATVRDNSLRLETRITEIFSGNPYGRAYIGLGAGATQVQIEGRLIEIKSGRVMMEFADRRKHGGSTILMGRQATMDAEYLIGKDMKEILKGVVKLFVFMREEGSLSNIR